MLVGIMVFEGGGDFPELDLFRHACLGSLK